jgi:hypothetical protein
MSVMKPPNSGESLADGLEDYPPDARLDAIYAAMEARLEAEFDRHRDDLLAMLQKVCERTSKSFDTESAWDHIRFYASRYLLEEASVEEKRMMEPAADRVERLRQLGNALAEARCKLDEARDHVICVVLFEEWCKARGIPDFTDRHVAIFDDALADLIAGLAYLETAASRAAKQVRQKPGRPGGTGLLQQDFLISLELAYRDITGKPGGAGPGPFAQFVKKFLEAVGRTSTEQSITKAIKVAKKRREWGRSFFDGIGGKTPPSSP